MTTKNGSLREQHISVRVNADEYLHLQEQAKKARTPLAEFCRNVLMDKQVIQIPTCNLETWQTIGIQLGEFGNLYNYLLRLQAEGQNIPQDLTAEFGRAVQWLNLERDRLVGRDQEGEDSLEMDDLEDETVDDDLEGDE